MRVFFQTQLGEVITGLRFTATGIAFELDDIAGTLGSGGFPSSVPETATWALMNGGFAMTGAAMRRRKTLLAV